MGRWISGLMALGLLFGLGQPARAAEKSVAEEILDILHGQGQISDAQYDALLAKARAETRTVETTGQADPSTFRVYWDKGIRMETGDRRFKLKLGGRLQADWAGFREDAGLERSVGNFGNGAELRRARLYVAGTIYERIKFKAQYDFAGGDADMKDAYLDFTKLPFVGNLRVGHFKEPYGLEELTSSKYLTFMERSVANFAPSRNLGFMVHDHAANRRVTWAAGGFWESNDFGETASTEGPDRQFNLTGRVTALPWYEEDGAKLLHVGLSYSHKFRHEDGLRFRQRPEAHLATHRLVDTGTILADGADLLTPELALVYGPFSFQAEYTWARVDAARRSDAVFQGYYAQASYFLTGEHRAYKQAEGAFSRVSPRRNFMDGGGWGAWEVALRYSHADLSDGSVRGGRVDDFTAGVNWHLNPNVRISLDYVRSHRQGAGDLDFAEGRFQVDF